MVNEGQIEEAGGPLDLSPEQEARHASARKTALEELTKEALERTKRHRDAAYLCDEY